MLIDHVKSSTSRGGLLQFIGVKNRNGDTGKLQFKREKKILRIQRLYLALMFAANAGAHQITHLLQSEGADLIVTNNAKMTALHCAAAKYVLIVYIQYPT